MTQLTFLSAADQASVEAKLAEIEEKSGDSWACEVMKKQQLNDHEYLLEVTINGRFLQPLCLSSDASAERICRELDSLYRVRTASA